MKTGLQGGDRQHWGVQIIYMVNLAMGKHWTTTEKENENERPI